MARTAKSDDPQLMARVDAIARILVQAISAYLLAEGTDEPESRGEVFAGANLLCTKVELPARSRRSRR